MAGVEPRHVFALRQRVQDTRRREFSYSNVAGFDFLRGAAGLSRRQPIRKLRIGEGYAPWTWEHVTRFRYHVSRPEPWRATALELYSGQGPHDDLAMLWSDCCADGLMPVEQEKTGNKKALDRHACTVTCVPQWPVFPGAPPRYLPTSEDSEASRLARGNRQFSIR